MPVFVNLSGDALETIRRIMETAGDPATHLSAEQAAAKTIVDKNLVDQISIDENTWIIEFCYEHQPGGLARHLSISNLDRETTPNLFVWTDIASLFGFTHNPSFRLSKEHYKLRGQTTHIIELMEESMARKGDHDHTEQKPQ